jgi:glyoxylase-like metal-dependent hydrolase (beta-lactamase superfamily II)
MRNPFGAAATLALLAIAFAGAALAQSPQQAQGPLVQKIKGNLYFVRGGMAYGGFYVYDKGVIVIDAKMTAEGTKQTVAEIAKITPLPITHILITHSDGDHVNGLEAYPKGTAILSSEATKKEMEEAFKDEKLAGLRAYLPTQTFTKTFSLRIGNELIDLIPVGPAHTAGDTVIYFHDLKAVFAGDLAFIGRDPLIHRQKNGTSVGYAKALETMIGLDADTYLSGHNEPLTKADLKSLLASIREKQEKVGAMVKEGKTLDEIKKAIGVADAPAAAGGFRWPSLVEIIYLELTEKK